MTRAVRHDAEAQPSSRPVVMVPHTSAPGVDAGEKITRGKHGVRSGASPGCATLIVRRGGTRFAMTCAHVLGPKVGAAPGGENLVFAPELSECCGAECSKHIGTVDDASLKPDPGEEIQQMTTVNGLSVAVDAALIALEPDAKASNEVPKIGLIKAVRDLVAEWDLSDAGPKTLTAAQKFAVRKYGPTTGFTRGTISGIAEVEVCPAGATAPFPKAWLLEIDVVPEPGASPVVEVLTLDMERMDKKLAITDPADVPGEFTGLPVTVTMAGTAEEPTMTVSAHYFSRPGDSGSPIVDNDGKIIGLLYGGVGAEVFVKGESNKRFVGSGRSRAIFIQGALQLHNVEMLPSSGGTAGAAVTQPGMGLERGFRETIDWAAVDHVRAAFEATPDGARLGALARRHFPELRQLVHHRRRVLVTWHRNKGPGFVNALVKASMQPGWPMPREVAGVGLPEALAAMREVLLAEGSPALRRAIVDNAELVMRLAHQATGIDDILAHLARHRPAVRIVNARGVPGTVAGLVRDGSGTRYLLANHHVVFGDGARAGEQVWAMPPADDPILQAVRLGPARTGEIGLVGVGEYARFVDCALIEVDDDYPPWIVASLEGAAATGTTQARADTTVLKHGPATGTTHGTVLDADYPDHPFIAGQAFTAPGQILVGSSVADRSFAAPGDSGAALLDRDGRMVGLLWGSNESGDGLACPIDAVLECLGVSLPEPMMAGGGRG